MSTSSKQTQVNLTIEWLRAKHPQLADAVLAGMPVSEVWDKSQIVNLASRSAAGCHREIAPTEPTA